MSYRIAFRETELIQRKKFIAELTFEKQDKYNKKSESIHAFDVDEGEIKQRNIYLPLGYAYSIKYMNEYNYPTANIKFTGTLRPIQEEIMPEIINNLKINNTCKICIPCGMGKTVIAIYIASVLKLKTIIVLFNKLMLVEQWIETIKKLTDSNVQYLQAGQKFDLSHDFFIINAINIPKFGRIFNNIGYVISDECHLSATANGIKALLHLTPKYIVGLSATPFRLDGLNCVLDVFYGNFNVTKTYTREHQIIPVKTGLKLEYTYTHDGKIDWNSVLNSQAMHLERNKVIVRLICKWSKRNFLVLSRRVEQAKLLETMLKKKSVSVDILVGMKKKYDETARVLVATSAKCSVGFDHPFMDSLLLAGDAEAYFEQFLGRILARSPITPIVFDFIDDAPGILWKHFKSREEIYKKFGGLIF